jgi:hypothetical protein
MKYVWRDGAQTKGLDPTVAAEELARIHGKYGQLRTDDVVEESKPPQAPLHPGFTWDDQACGIHWRRYEARQIVRSVVVIKNDNVKESLFTHVEVVKDDATDRFYQRTDLLLKRIDEFASAMRLAQSAVLQAEARVLELKALSAKGTRPQSELRKLHVLSEAMSSAREIAKSLVA